MSIVSVSVLLQLSRLDTFRNFPLVNPPPGHALYGGGGGGLGPLILYLSGVLDTIMCMTSCPSLGLNTAFSRVGKKPNSRV